MKRNEILGEHKKGVRAVKYNAKPKTHAEPSKPTNPVAKNASAAIGGGAAGAHKDAKKASQSVRGQKHKAQPEMAEGRDGNGVEEFLYKVARSGDNGFDMLYNAQQGKYGREIERTIQDMYDDISIDTGYHGDDDFEQIYDRMLDNIEADYGQQGVAEGERTMSRAAKGYEKYGKAGMQALAKAGREGKDLEPVRNKYDKYDDGVAEMRDRRDSYQRDYDFSQSGFGDQSKREFKRREMEHELGHETNNYAVAIDGRTWKVFADKNHAQAVARSLQNKGKKASVHETGAEPTTEATGADVGKITKVDPATKKATLTKPDGTSMEVDSTALKPTPDGKMSMDTPDLKTGTAVVSTEAADVPYQVKQGPQPMAMTSPRPTAIVASKKWTAITPDIEAKATQQGFRKVMLKVNGQMVPGLEGGDQAMGSKIIVAPTDFQTMTGDRNSENAPHVPKDYQTKEPLKKGPDGKWRNSKGEERDSMHGGPVNNGAAMFRSMTPRPPTQESSELTAMLRIAGLR